MAAASYGYVIVPPLFLFHLTLGLFGNWTTNMTRSPFSSGYCHCGEGGEERSLCLRAPTSFEISFPSDGIERRLLGRASELAFRARTAFMENKRFKVKFHSCIFMDIQRVKRIFFIREQNSFQFA